MADNVSLPVGGTQIDSLPSKTAVQDSDKIPISRDGSTASVTVADFNDKTNGIVSDAFSTNVAYEVGDYCIYNDTLYKCTTAHSKKAWSNSDFEATDVGTELSELNTNFIITKEIVVDNVVLVESGNYTISQDVSINGYVPIGLMYRLGNASVDGYFCSFTHAYIVDIVDGLLTFSVESTTDSKIKITIHIIYAKQA